MFSYIVKVFTVQNYTYCDYCKYCDKAYIRGDPELCVYHKW